MTHSERLNHLMYLANNKAFAFLSFLVEMDCSASRGRQATNTHSPLSAVFFFFDCQSACVGTSRCLCRDYDWNNGKRRCTAMFPVQLFWAVIENGPTKPDALSQNDA